MFATRVGLQRVRQARKRGAFECTDAALAPPTLRCARHRARIGARFGSNGGSAMATEWYYQNMGQTVGPLSAGQLRVEVADGQIGPDTLVRKGGEGKWVLARHLAGMFPQPGIATGTAKPQEKFDLLENAVLDWIGAPMNIADRASEMLAEPPPARPSRRAKEAKSDHLAIPEWHAPPDAAARTHQSAELPIRESATRPGSFPPPKLPPCPDCGDMVSKRATQCPRCGCPLEVEKPLEVKEVCIACKSQFPGCGCPLDVENPLHAERVCLACKSAPRAPACLWCERCRVSREAIAIGRARLDPKKRSSDRPSIKCRRCGSGQLSANNKGFGLGKAVAGGVLLGPAGLLAGFIGSGQVKITCLRCGHTWDAGG